MFLCVCVCMYVMYVYVFAYVCLYVHNYRVGLRLWGGQEHRNPRRLLKRHA